MKKLILIFLRILFINSTLNFLIRTYISIDQFESYYILKIGVKIFLIVLTLLLIRKYLNTIKLFKNNLYFLPIAAILFYLSFNKVIDVLDGIPNLNNTLFFMSCFSVAIFEELFLRVYVYQSVSKIFTDKSMIFHIMLTSVFFGLAHISNFFNSEVLKITVITQILLAFGLGFLFQSLLIRFKNIFLIIALHTIINYLGAYKTKLLFLSRETESFTINDFLLSTIFSIVLVIILMLLSYLILKPLLRKKRASINP